MASPRSFAGRQASRPARNFRAYLDRRLAFYKDVTNTQAVQRAISEATGFQREIWRQGIDRLPRDIHQHLHVGFLVPQRDVRYHDDPDCGREDPHAFGDCDVTCSVPLMCSFLAGMSLANGTRRSWTHTIIFAPILSLTVFVNLRSRIPACRTDPARQFRPGPDHLKSSMQSSI